MNASPDGAGVIPTGAGVGTAVNVNTHVLKADSQLYMKVMDESGPYPRQDSRKK